MARRPRWNPRPRLVRGACAALCTLATLLVASGVASAKTEREAGYTFDQAWATAVRHLVVNERVKVTDKDASVGYVVFELKDDGKVFAGAFELIRLKEGGRESVRLVITLEDRPDYMEATMLNRMLAKLRQEHGDPPPPREERKPKEPAPKPAEDTGPTGSKPAPQASATAKEV